MASSAQSIGPSLDRVEVVPKPRPPSVCIYKVTNVDRNNKRESSMKKGSSRGSSNISKGMIVRYKHMAAICSSEKYSKQQYAALCIAKLKAVKSQQFTSITKNSLT